MNGVVKQLIEDFAGEVSEAVRTFGTYLFGDRGPQEVMDYSRCYKKTKELDILDQVSLLAHMKKWPKNQLQMQILAEYLADDLAQQTETQEDCDHFYFLLEEEEKKVQNPECFTISDVENFIKRIQVLVLSKDNENSDRDATRLEVELYEKVLQEIANNNENAEGASALAEAALESKKIKFSRSINN